MKKIVSVVALVFGLFFSTVSAAAPREHFITVNALQVITGRDLGMPEVTLYWGDSVTYELDATAKLLFKFRAPLQAITMFAGSTDALSDVVLSGNDAQLTVTIKDNTPEWRAKATLFFLPLGVELPAIGGLDPTISNGGVRGG